MSVDASGLIKDHPLPQHQKALDQSVTYHRFRDITPRPSSAATPRARPSTCIYLMIL